MLQPPTLDENLIVRALAEDYDLRVTELAFLPLGADVNTAVYKAVAADGTQYFVKLRSGAFDSISVEVPAALHAQGIAEVMAPAATVSGSLWADVSAYRLMLYPFVEGRNGYERDLSDAQWRALGAALRAVHTATLPDALWRRIPRESYPPLARDILRAFMAQPALRGIHDAAAARLE